MHHQLSSLQPIYLFIYFYIKYWLLINCGRFMNSQTEWWWRYFSVCLPCWADDKKLKVDARQGLQMELSCFMRYWCLFEKKNNYCRLRNLTLHDFTCSPWFFSLWNTKDVQNTFSTFWWNVNSGNVQDAQRGRHRARGWP